MSKEVEKIIQNHYPQSKLVIDNAEFDGEFLTINGNGKSVMYTLKDGKVVVYERTKVLENNHGTEMKALLRELKLKDIIE